MKADLISKLGTIAGIGGISLGVLFFIFREIIRKKIFPSLTKEQTYKLINRIIFFTTLVAIVGIGAWLITEIQNFDYPPTKGSLKIVDISIKDQSDKYPILYITVRNTGEIAFLKRADFRVKKVLSLYSPYCYQIVPISRDYDLELPIIGAPYKKSLPISYSINSQGTKILIFKICKDTTETSENSNIFIIEIDFVYNEDDKILSTSPIAFVIKPMAYLMPYDECKDIRRVYLKNKSVIKEFEEFNGLVSPELENIRTEFSKSKVPWLLEKISKSKKKEDIKYYVEYLVLIQTVDDKAVDAINTLSINSPNTYVKELINKLKVNNSSMRR